MRACVCHCRRCCGCAGCEFDAGAAARSFARGSLGSKSSGESAGAGGGGSSSSSRSGSGGGTKVVGRCHRGGGRGRYGWGGREGNGPDFVTAAGPVGRCDDGDAGGTPGRGGDAAAGGGGPGLRRPDDAAAPHLHTRRGFAGHTGPHADVSSGTAPPGLPWCPVLPLPYRQAGAQRCGLFCCSWQRGSASQQLRWQQQRERQSGQQQQRQQQRRRRRRREVWWQHVRRLWRRACSRPPLAMP